MLNDCKLENYRYQENIKRRLLYASAWISLLNKMSALKQTKQQQMK